MCTCRKDADTLNNIASNQSMQGLLVESTRTYKQAIKKAPRDALLWYNCGYTLIRMGKMADASVMFEQACKLKPEYAASHNNLAYVHAILLNSTSAIKHAKEAVNLEPDNAGYYDTLSFAYLTDGKNDKALQAALKAISIDMNHPEALYHCGVSNWRLGNHAKAREILKELKTRDQAWAGLLANELEIDATKGHEATFENRDRKGFAVAYLPYFPHKYMPFARTSTDSSLVNESPI